MYVVYSKPGCPHCTNAKQLLESKGLEYREVVLDVGQQKNTDTEYYTIEQLRKLVPDVRTVPQVFLENNNSLELIGGYSSLEFNLKQV